MRNEKGEIVGILGISFDITERKENEKALEKAKRKAEESILLKKEFMRNMEHDIRTPFSGIYGLAEILVHSEADPYWA